METILPILIPLFSGVMSFAITEFIKLISYKTNYVIKKEEAVVLLCIVVAIMYVIIKSIIPESYFKIGSEQSLYAMGIATLFYKFYKQTIENNDSTRPL